MIRRAQIGDLDTIVSMGERFYRGTSYSQWSNFCPESARLLAQMLIEEGVVLLADGPEGPVGMVGLAVVPFMFNQSVLAAHEVFWWIEPEARGGLAAWRLLKAVEPACIERGCAAIQMTLLGDSPEIASSMYRRAGYSHTETSFTKMIRSQ